jgi:hypothetical protein
LSTQQEYQKVDKRSKPAVAELLATTSHISPKQANPIHPRIPSVHHQNYHLHYGYIDAALG